MSVRELVVLGTASQVPTRTRNHNGYLLRWDGEGILFDPGEGTQRQMTYAGVSASQITRICITHFHGDHCLGLPGVVQRLSLDGVTRAIDVHVPAGGEVHLDRLLQAAVFADTTDLRRHPTRDGDVTETPVGELRARALAHRIETVGWRLDEPAERRMLPERLDEAGIRGADVGRLIREGTLEVGGRTVRVADVSEHRPGQSFAFVMDTSLCDGAFALADGVDLLVCEATFLSEDESLAREYGHLTAAQAARVAAESGVRQLVLTHFSQRYADDAERFLDEAGAIFPDVLVASDLDRVAIPPRR